MFTSYQQDAVQNHNRKIANKSFQNVAKFAHLGATLTNQNLIHEDIMSRPNFGNTCYNFVQNPLPACLASKKVGTQTYTTIILLISL
jgi:hypothetical protein